jgi:hypothetical protein
MRIRERKLASFIEWGPASIQVALSRSSPYVKSSHRVSGLMLANHTSIRHLFNRTLSQFDKMYKKKALVHNYQGYPLFHRKDANGNEVFDPEEFEDAREVVGAVSSEYAACEQADFVRIFSYTCVCYMRTNANKNISCRLNPSVQQMGCLAPWGKWTLGAVLYRKLIFIRVIYTYIID